MKKRILSLLLCVLMVLALFPLTVWAEDTYEIQNAGALTKNGEALPVGTILEAGTVVTVKNTEETVTLTVLKLDGAEKVSVTGPNGEQTVTFDTAVRYNGVSPTVNDSVVENVSYFVTYVEEETVIEEKAVLEKEEEKTLEATEELEKSELPEEPVEEVEEPSEEAEKTEEVEEPVEEVKEVEEPTEEIEETKEPVEEKTEELPEQPKKLLAGTEAKTVTFRIRFDPNNGGLDQAKTVEAVLPVDEYGSGTYTVPANEFKAPEGKEFAYWSYAANYLIDGEENTIRSEAAADDEISLNEDFYDITLTAQWKDSGKYRVSYYDFSFDSYEDREDVYYSEAKLPDPLPTRTNPAYNFIGWSVDWDDYSVLATPGMALTGDTKLYGVWSFNVHYEGNGGTGSMKYEVISFDKDEFDAPECGFTAPEGKVFAGWKVKTALPSGSEAYIADPGDTLFIDGFYYGHLTLTAQWKDQIIHSVNAEIVEPMAGAKPDFDVEFTSDPEDVLNVEDGYEACWYVRGEDNWVKMSEKDVFETGKTYAVDIYVGHKDGYSFTKDTVATLNGKPHNNSVGESYSEGNSGKLYISGEWTVGEAKKDIGAVIARIDAPFAGKTPDGEADIEFMIFDEEESIELATKKVTWNWETEYGPLPLDGDMTFQSGRRYSVTVTVEAPEGYKFAEDGDWFIDDLGIDGAYDAVNPTVLKLTRTWELPKVSPTAVTKVTAEVKEPVVGEHPDFAPKATVTPTGGASLESEFSTGVSWSVYDTETMEFIDFVEPEDVFESGKTYRASVTFVINDGFVFDSNIEGTLNGKNCENIFDPFMPKYVDLKYYWTLSDKTPITEIKAAVTAPEVGKKPSKTATILTTPSNAVSGEDVSLVWYVSDTNSKNGSDWVEMKENETFTAGKFYSVDIFAKAKEGYIFSDKVVGKVNGRNHVSTFGPVYDAKKPAEAYLSYVWKLGEVEISYIAAKVTAPAIGKTPSYSVTATSVPANAIEKISSVNVDWYVYDAKTSRWKTLSSTAIFEENTIYRVDMTVFAKDGYVFGKKVKGTVNGEDHNSKTPIYDADYPAEAFLSYTWKSADKYAITGDEDWTKGDSDSMTFRSTAPYSKFKGVRVDGVKIASKNYTVKEGSTVVSLKPAYLETLSIGLHTLTIVSTDGEATTTFEILSKTNPNCEHKKTKTINKKDATCTAKGYTGDVVCKKCGKVLEKGKEIPALGHKFVNGKCSVCGAKEGENNPNTGASYGSLAVAAILAGAAAFVAFKKRK